MYRLLVRVYGLSDMPDHPRLDGLQVVGKSCIESRLALTLFLFHS